MFRFSTLWLPLAMTLLLALIIAGCSSSGDDGDASGEGSAAAAASDSGGEEAAGTYKLKQELDMSIELTSPVFNRIRRIPIQYTCEKNEKYEDRTGETLYGEEKSPPLAWTGVPDGTVSIALIMDDPDAVLEFADHPEPWIHWVVWGIPADVVELPEDLPKTTELPSIGPNVRQGTNEYGLTGYSGPCPPANITSIFKRRDYYQSSVGVSTRAPYQPHGYMFRIYALDADIDLPVGSSKDDLLRAIDGHVIAAGELKGEFVNKHVIK